MKNDENMDINLAQEQDLTDDKIKQARQDYATAMRYVNIAEHMNKFEDQAKYYHRAIDHLRKVKPVDESVAPEIKKYQHLKYAARAKGKVELYEEACELRDHAKTPSDYSSAKAMFERIHKYTDGKAQPKEFTPPEYYDKAMKYVDSEQQAKYCEEQEELLEAKLKRHSLYTSIFIIAAIAALLVYSRTVSFKGVLGGVNSVLHNYTKSWQEYQYVYNHTNSEKAYIHYQENRYKAAEYELSQDDKDAAASDFRALAQDDYKDSADRLIALNQEMIQETELGEVVTFAGMDWRVLAKEDGKALLLKDKSMSGIFMNDTDDNNVTWETCSARTWLNGSFLDENFIAAETAVLEDTAVTADSNPEYGASSGSDTTDKVYLLSSQDVQTYYSYIHPTETCWWLRTAGANPGTMAFVYRDEDRTVMNYGYSAYSSTFNIKPAVWVDLQ